MPTNNSSDFGQKLNGETCQDKAEGLRSSNPAQFQRILKSKGLFTSPLWIFIFLQVVYCLIYVACLTFLSVMNKISVAESENPWASPIEGWILFMLLLSGAQAFAFCTFAIVPRLYKKYGFTPTNPGSSTVFPWSLSVNQRNNTCPTVTYKSLLIFSFAASGVWGGLVVICFLLLQTGFHAIILEPWVVGSSTGYYLMHAVGIMVILYGQGFWLPVILQIISFTNPSLAVKKNLNKISICCCGMLTLLFFPLNLILWTMFTMMSR